MRLEVHVYRSYPAVRSLQTVDSKVSGYYPPSSMQYQHHAESDIVLLQSTRNSVSEPILTKPLSRDDTISTHKGNLSHADIIGKRARDIVQTAKGSGYRIHEVSLGDYVRLSKRLVTPIYPSDANVIVSLFDIHVSPPVPDDAPEAPKLEILEAGTGHGALTLYLSRAIHAANPAKPAFMNLLASRPPSSPSSEGSQDEGSTEVGQSAASNYLLDQWKKERRAVLHTIDNRNQYSKHAKKTVQGFRNGMYADNVDFHVGDVSQWVNAQLQTRQESTGSESASPFLTHALLDLPGAEEHLATVASAMHNDGTLIVFNPSITQVIDCFRKTKEASIPLHLVKVLELGTNGATGGREWEVGAVRPRASSQTTVTEAETETRSDEDVAATASESEVSTRDEEQAAAVSSGVLDKGWKFICRPKVGGHIVGGGFLGVFRKKNAVAEKAKSGESVM